MTDRHRWTPDDDAALHAAVEAVLPLRDRLGGRMAFWAAVVGRLCLDLSPDGARSRFERLTRERKAEEAAAKAALDAVTAKVVAGPVVPVESTWDRVARQVDEYERTVGEATLETVTELGARMAQIQRSQSRSERMLVRLCSAWSVDIGPEDER